MTSLNLPVPSWMTEDLVLLEEQARRFIAAEYVPKLEGWNERGMYDRDVWTKAGAAGLLCPAIPEEYSGVGGSFAHEVVISRELSLAGFDLFGAPLHSGIVAPYILHYGTEEQKRRWLPGLVSGELVGAIAMSEPGTGSDLQGVRTTARKSGNGYVLNGSKTFITNGQHANLIVVVAKTDVSAGAKGVSLMVVESDGSPGFRRGRKLKKLGMDAADTSELFFDDVQLPPENLLGSEEGQGFAQLMNDLPRERLIVAVHAQAMMERALALTIEYVKQRLGVRQEDHRVSEHAVRAGRMQVRGNDRSGFSRLLRREIPQRHARYGDRFHGEIPAHRPARDDHRPLSAVVWRLRLHGGVSDIAHVPRRARDAIYGGTNEIMKLLIARSL